MSNLASNIPSGATVSAGKTFSAKLPKLFGLPPLQGAAGFSGSPDEGDRCKDLMPVLEIEPCNKHAEMDMNMFTLTNGWTTPDAISKRSYTQDLLEHYGVDAGGFGEQNYLRMAYLEESPTSETFNNDFGDSIFAELTENSAAPFIKDVAEVMGINNMKDMEAALGTAGKLAGDSASAAVGGFIGKLKQIGNAPSGIGKLASEAGNIAMHSILGHGLDFPQIWRGANWGPNYSYSVRLYNPIPGNEQAMLTYIVAPLAAILMMVVPRSDDGHHFYSPWYCRFRVPGLVPWTPGYLKSVNVIKGGDHDDLTWGQRPGTVDVKMDFGVLFKTMVGGKYNSESASPQLQPWLAEFIGTKTWSGGGPATWYPKSAAAAARQAGSSANDDSQWATNTSKDGITTRAKVGNETDYFDPSYLNDYSDPNIQALIATRLAAKAKAKAEQERIVDVAMADVYAKYHFDESTNSIGYDVSATGGDMDATLGTLGQAGMEAAQEPGLSASESVGGVSPAGSEDIDIGAVA